MLRELPTAGESPPLLVGFKPLDYKCSYCPDYFKRSYAVIWTGTFYLFPSFLNFVLNCFMDPFLLYWLPLSLLLLETVCAYQITVLPKPAPSWPWSSTRGLCVSFCWDCWGVSITDSPYKLLYCWQPNDHSKHPNMTCKKKTTTLW